MAFLEEDGSGLALANSYQSLAAFKSYHDDRASDYSASNDAAIQVALIRATDHIDRTYGGRFVGDRLNSVQRLEWPRTNAFDRDERLVSGVPLKIAEATSEYAFRALSATLMPDPTVEDTGVRVLSKTEKVGPLLESTDFANGGSYSLPMYPNADRLITEFLQRGNRLRRG